MPDTYDFKSYRQAVAYVSDIKKILVVFWQIRKLLQPHQKYKAVANMLAELRKQEGYLNAHYLKYNSIVQTKGRLPPQTQ